MISEAYVIKLTCDTPQCVSAITVQEVSEEACNLRLHLIGWRINGRTGKHLCPYCVGRRKK